MDSRQRLTPKTHGAYRFKFIQTGDLASRVTLQCDGQLVCWNTSAVVFYADQADATAEKSDSDVRSTRV